jgi:hypothetical protein
MKKLLLVSALTLAVAFGAFADIVNKTSVAEHNPGIAPPVAGGGAAGSCTLVYYNFCSGWIWLWSGWTAGDQVGVNFDMPADCGKLAGETCCLTDFFWYWRYTAPGYGFTVTYGLYNTDANGCLTTGVGGPTLDPIERWNYTLGFGCATSDVVALTATWDNGTLPYAATDNNASNLNAGPACNLDPGTPGAGTSLQYVVAGTTVYCPPAAFADGVGYTDLAMQAYFTCDVTATEDASWGEIKSLFQ